MEKINKILNSLIAAITFLLSFIVYFSTMAPTTSFWDCGEFIATSATMGVPHPPGTPLYLLLGNVFSQIPIFADIGARVNLISVIVSAFAVMFVYLISVQIIEEWRGYTKSTTDKIINYGSSFIGAMTFSVTDSHWFNAVEAEVYSLSTFFTAIVVWLILKWSKEHNKPGNYRYLLIIAYIIGLATALHLLNLLALPFIALIIYFKKYESREFTSLVIGTMVALIYSAIALVVIYIGIIKGVPNLIDQLYKIPYFGMQFDSPLNILTKLLLPLSTVLFLLIGFVLLLTKKKNSQLLKISIASLLMVYIGFSTYSIIFIRASQEPRINENSPNTLKEFISYMNRDQYGQWSILDRASSIGRDEMQYWNRYTHNKKEEAYTDKNNNGKWEYGEKYTDSNNNGKWDPGPKRSEVARFVWKYQIKEMYLRYFAWQFIGKEKWEDRSWELNTLAEYYTDDNKNRTWDIGEDFEDANENGRWDNSQNIKNLQGIDWFRYFVPFAFLLGIIGMIYHFYSDYRRALALLSIFLATGLLIVAYLNQYDPQPRERDYSYVGSFFIFSIWISIGLSGLIEQLHNILIKEKIKKNIQHATYGSIIGFMFLAMPFVMFVKDFNEHNRKGNYVAWDYAYNLLNSCEPNGILFTNGDNDTFPLWYLQEIEDIRKDVRVVNLSLLNTPWYIDQLQNQEPKINLSIDEWIVDKDWIIEPKYKLHDEAGCKDPDALNYNPEITYYCDFEVDIDEDLKYDFGEKFDDDNNNGKWDENEGFYDENGNDKYDRRYKRIDYRYSCCQYLDPISGTGYSLEEWSPDIWSGIVDIGNSIFKDNYRDYGFERSEKYNVNKHGIPFAWGPASAKLNLYDKNITFTLKPTLSNYLKVQDVMILQILENVEHDRPVYFAVTVAPSNRLGLEQYLEMQGLVYQITNELGDSPASPRINFEKMNFNIMQSNNKSKIITAKDYEQYMANSENNGVYRYTNLDNQNVYFPHHIIRLAGNYRSGFLQLAIEKLEENQGIARNITKSNYLDSANKIDRNNEIIVEILDQMNNYLPSETIPIDIPINIQIASFYAMADNKERATEILDPIAKNPNLNSEDTFMLYQAYSDYIGDYYTGIELLVDLHLKSEMNGENQPLLMEGLKRITDLQNSIEILSEFKIKYPQIAEFRYNIAIAYAKKEQIQNAINELSDWLKINPLDPTAIQFIKDLESLQK